MPDKQCENGHMIDESWDLCPYCPQGRREQLSVVRPRTVNATEAPSPSYTPSRGSLVEDHSIQPVFAEMINRTSAQPKIGMSVSENRFVVGWLVGLNKSFRGESFPVRTGRNTIGRDRRSDIVLSDDLASGHHADLVFRPEEKRFILMDSNSTNGTFVNDLEIQPRCDLKEKDVIKIGTLLFLFVPLCREEAYWEEEGSLR